MSENKVKYFKLPKSKEVIKVSDPNTFNIYTREGFEEVDKEGKPVKKEDK